MRIVLDYKATGVFGRAALKFPKIVVAAAGVLLLAACAGSTSLGGDPSTVGVSVPFSMQSGYADSDAIKSEIAKIMSKPVDADAAARLALLASPALHQIYFELRIDDRDIVETLARIPSGEPDLERRFAAAIVGRQSRANAAVDRLNFEQHKIALAGAIVRTGLDVRRLHVDAVSARKFVEMNEELKTASDAAAELTRRMARVGNLPRLNEYRESVSQAEVTIQLAKSRQIAVAARERFVRALPLGENRTRLELAGDLPKLPESVAGPEDPEEEALGVRYDIQALRYEIAAQALDLQLDGYDGGQLLSRTRFVQIPLNDVFDPGRIMPPINAPYFSLSIQQVSARAAGYMAQFNRLGNAALQAGSEAREATAARMTTYDIARAYEKTIGPIQERIWDESVYRYNGMLTSVFDLLAEARQRLSVRVAATDALRDFWLADIEYRRAVYVGDPIAGVGSAGSTASSRSGGGGD